VHRRGQVTELELGLLLISCRLHYVYHNTGINTGIPVLIFLNTEIPVLPNVVGIGGPSYNSENFHVQDS